MNHYSNRCQKLSFSVISILLVCLSFYANQYYIEADATSYLTIAKNYSDGNWQDAINGVWPPLSSWIMSSSPYESPFINLQLLKLIGIISGLTAVYLFDRRFVPKYLELQHEFRFLPTIIVLIIVLAFAPSRPVDILPLPFLFLFLDELLHNKSPRGIKLGLLASISFYAKFFNLYFCLLSVAIVLLIKKEIPLKKSFHTLIYFIGTLIILLAPWQWCINQKYDNFVFLSHAGKFHIDNRLQSPISEYEQNYDVKKYLFQPISKHSTSYWENIIPLDYTQQKTIGGNLKKYIAIIIINLNEAWNNIHWFNPFFSISVLLILYFYRFRNIGILAVLNIIFLLGYCLIFAYLRYLPIIFIFSVLFLFKVLSNLPAKHLSYFTIVSCLILLATPMKLAFYSGWHLKQEVYELSNNLRKLNLPKHINICSDNEWDLMAEISYYNNYKYHGVTHFYVDQIVLDSTIQAQEINYFFEFENPPNSQYWKKHYELPSHGLTIWERTRN